MSKNVSNLKISDKLITEKIYNVRGENVMLDSDLAKLYGVETKRLKEQVKRNASRFPEDFMFELTNEEWDSLRSQFATLNAGRGKHTKYLPIVFTENGVAMLSSVLNSDQAISVNIQIIRLFTKMREYFVTHKEVLLQLQKMEKKVLANEGDIKVLFDLMKKLLVQESEERTPVGYKTKKNK